MSPPALHPGHILVYSPEEIQRLLGESSDEPASDALSVSNWATNSYQIAAISADGQTISALVLIRRGHRLRTTTDKYRVFFDHSVQFAPITLKELSAKKLLTLFKNHSHQMLNTVAPDDWQKLMLGIKSLRPQSETQIQHLEDLLKKPIPTGAEKSSDGWMTVAHERDALYTALQLSGFPTTLMPVPVTTQPSSVLHSLAVDKTEQHILLEDMAKGLQGWQADGINDKGLHIARFRDKHRRLTVMNVNTTSLEETLGVDLIYYRPDLNSYILIQYKRMRKNANNRWAYYPEGSYEKEYKTMAARAKEAKHTPAESLDEYRFHHHWNYFKFCPGDAFDPQSNQVIRGYYVPFDFWQLYEQSPESKGERGAFRFTQDTAHLDTHTFTQLVNIGWIGSRGSVSDDIGTMIHKQLNPKRKHSVMIAILSAETVGQQGMEF